MGGDVGQRGAFVLDATHGMAVDAVVEIVKAAGEASGQTISHGLVRMLSKLATHAELGSEQVRSLADSALREQVQQPAGRLEARGPQSRAVRPCAAAPGHDLSHRSLDANGPGEPAGAPEPLRVVQMSLEAGAQGPLLDRAVDNAMAGGQVGAVLVTLTTRPEGRDEVCDAVQTRLVAPSTVRALLAQEPIDVASLDELLPFMWEEGYELLLDALASSESRATRRKLLDRLAGAAVDIRSSIAARLDDPRWYVQRNMLVLLARSGRVPEGFSAAPWTTHEDARVRIEAVRLQLTLPHEHDLGVRTALDDSDPRIVRLGLAAIQYVCPPDLVARVTSIAGSSDADEELRGLAVGALAQFRQPQVLEMLLQLLDGGKTMLGRSKLAAKSPAVLAALRALADQWSSERRARTMLALGADSADRRRAPGGAGVRGHERSRPLPQRVRPDPLGDDALPGGPSVARTRRRSGVRGTGRPVGPRWAPRVHVPRRRGRVRPRGAARSEVLGAGPPADCRRHPAARVRAQGHAGTSSTASSRRFWRG